MARTGLSNLISIVRNLAQIGTADYSISGVTYWTDDQIETELMRYHNRVWNMPLLPVPFYTGGTATYYTYVPSKNIKNFEGTASGTAYWRLVDSLGSAVPSYSVDSTSGIVSFDSNTSGTVFYLSAFYYNINRTVAQIWRAKASKYASSFDFSSNDQSFKTQQKYENALKQANYFDSLEGVRVTTMERYDLAYDN